MKYKIFFIFIFMNSCLRTTESDDIIDATVDIDETSSYCPTKCWKPARCSASGYEECTYNQETNCCEEYTDSENSCEYIVHCNIEICPEACLISVYCSASGYEECTWNAKTNCCLPYPEPKNHCNYSEQCNICGTQGCE